jgi:hypothetical protein
MSGELADLLDIDAVKVMRLEPTDLILLSTPSKISPSTATEIQSILSDELAKLGLYNRIMVLSDGLSLSVLRAELGDGPPDERQCL